MDIHNLIKMANNIGSFFQSEPDRDVAIAGIEQHLRNFWEPRMRQSIIAYRQDNGGELMDIVAAAVDRLAKA